MWYTFYITNFLLLFINEHGIVWDIGHCLC